MVGKEEGAPIIRNTRFLPLSLPLMPARVTMASTAFRRRETERETEL